VKTNKSYIIKKRSKNKVLFVEFIFNSRQIQTDDHGYDWNYNAIAQTDRESH